MDTIASAVAKQQFHEAINFHNRLLEIIFSWRNIIARRHYINLKTPRLIPWTTLFLTRGSFDETAASYFCCCPFSGYCTDFSLFSFYFYSSDFIPHFLEFKIVVNIYKILLHSCRKLSSTVLHLLHLRFNYAT